jgi:hypothetical protein
MAENGIEVIEHCALIGLSELSQIAHRNLRRVRNPDYLDRQTHSGQYLVCRPEYLVPLDYQVERLMDSFDIDRAGQSNHALGAITLTCVTLR